jgi:dihydrofolate reductase
MAKVLLDMAVSLDGFIVGRNDEYGGLYDWYFAEEGRNKEVVAEIVSITGAIVMGRNTFGTGQEQGADNDNPYKIPHFVVTHNPPTELPKGEIKYTFVTDGIESALAQAQAVVSGGRYVVIAGGADVARQYMRAGLVDEIQLHVVPVLLGGGKRLLDDIRFDLEQIRVIEAPGVTHLWYTVRRKPDAKSE